MSYANRKFITEHRYRVDDETGCWVWQLSRTYDGYGRLSVHGRSVPAHVHFWEAINGPKPPNTELDHLCKNRACCNPAHLELVSKVENIRRGDSTTSSRRQMLFARLLDDFGMSIATISDITGLTANVISKLRRGLRWKDITSEVAQKEIIVDNMEKLKPGPGRVFIRPFPVREESKGGILIPEAVQAAPDIGRITVAAESSKFSEGDVVVFSRHGVSANLEDGDLIVNEGFVFAVVGEQE